MMTMPMTTRRISNRMYVPVQRGGCGRCGGYQKCNDYGMNCPKSNMTGAFCGGMLSPEKSMEVMMEHIQDGSISGGELAHRLVEYSGEGFLSDLLGTIGQIAPILSSLPIPGISNIARIVSGVAPVASQIAKHAGLGVNTRGRKRLKRTRGIVRR
jgi:hypothetical protein